MMERAPRIRVNDAARMVAPDGYESDVIVLDVSAGGFRLEHSDDLHPGDRITLITAKGEMLGAFIKWSLGIEAGGTFDEKPAAFS